ncbi:MAG TPA: hypothetical protein PK478_13855, partial [Nitrospira sp.]|nr:hypothetical protein [Nitrospira sp.]
MHQMIPKGIMLMACGSEPVVLRQAVCFDGNIAHSNHVRKRSFHRTEIDESADKDDEHHTQTW